MLRIETNQDGETEQSGAKALGKRGEDDLDDL